MNKQLLPGAMSQLDLTKPVLHKRSQTENTTWLIPVFGHMLSWCLDLEKQVALKGHVGKQLYRSQAVVVDRGRGLGDFDSATWGLSFRGEHLLLFF